MANRNSNQHNFRDHSGGKNSHFERKQNTRKYCASSNEVVEKFKGILRDISSENFEETVGRIKHVHLITMEHYIAVTDLIYEKAVKDQSASSAMASLSRELFHVSGVKIRNIIITKCQKEFEKDTMEEMSLNRKKEILLCSEPEKKSELQAKWDLRERSVGNIRFIGDLYKVGMLTSSIMMRVVGILLQKRDEESLECLSTLITVIGKVLETQCAQEAKTMLDLDRYYQTIYRIVNEELTSDRCRMLLLDVLQLRKNNWVTKQGNVNQKIEVKDDVQDTVEESKGRGVNEADATGQELAQNPSYDPVDVLKLRFHRMYSGKAPDIHVKPLGGYSNDSDWNFIDDQSMLLPIDLKYLPQHGKIKVNLDLNKGESKFLDYYGMCEKFRNLLKWILNHKNCLVEPSSQRLSVDFFIFTPRLKRIMKTPYHQTERWSILAVEHKGTIYLTHMKINEELYTDNEPDDTVEEEVEEQPVDKIGLWGHTLEYYMRGDDPEGGVDCVPAYRSIVKTSVGSNRLLLVCKMDCVDPNIFEKDFKNMEGFISIKCSKEKTFEGQKRFQRRFQFLEWWIEHHMFGIPRILVGYRNDCGIAHTLELLETEKLPHLAKGEWDPNVCINFLSQFLEFVKKKVMEDCKWTYKFEYIPGIGVYCSRCYDKDLTLPNWYKDNLFKIHNADEVPFHNEGH